MFKYFLSALIKLLCWNMCSFWNLINTDLFLVNKNKVKIISEKDNLWKTEYNKNGKIRHHQSTSPWKDYSIWCFLEPITAFYDYI